MIAVALTGREIGDRLAGGEYRHRAGVEAGPAQEILELGADYEIDARRLPIPDADLVQRTVAEDAIRSGRGRHDPAEAAEVPGRVAVAAHVMAHKATVGHANACSE